MRQDQLKGNQFKVFYARLGPNQTVAAFRQEVNSGFPHWKQCHGTIKVAVREQAAAVITSPEELEAVHSSEKQGATRKRDTDNFHCRCRVMISEEVQQNYTFLSLVSPLQTSLMIIGSNNQLIRKESAHESPLEILISRWCRSFSTTYRKNYSAFTWMHEWRRHVIMWNSHTLHLTQYHFFSFTLGSRHFLHHSEPNLCSSLFQKQCHHQEVCRFF